MRADPGRPHQNRADSASARARARPAGGCAWDSRRAVNKRAQRVIDGMAKIYTDSGDGSAQRALAAVHRLPSLDELRVRDVDEPGLLELLRAISRSNVRHLALPCGTFCVDTAALPPAAAYCVPLLGKLKMLDLTGCGSVTDAGLEWLAGAQ